MGRSRSLIRNRSIAQEESIKMFQTLRKRLSKDEEGFTLIELMVVVLIIAILIAIAIPTFLGARERAQDRAAQSNLRNALTAEKTYYTDEEEYTADASALLEIEPSLQYEASSVAPSDTGIVAVQVGVSNSVVCLTGESASGTTFVLKDIATGADAGTWYQEGAITACDASVASPWDRSGW